MKNNIPILIVLTLLLLGSCGSYHNKIRFSKTKKRTTKEIVSVKEAAVIDLDAPFNQIEEAVSYEETENREEANNEIVNTPTSRVDAFSDPVLNETTATPIVEAAKDQIADEYEPEKTLRHIKYSRNRAWLNTLGALLTIGTGIGLTILFFSSWVGGATLIGGIIGAYIFSLKVVLLHLSLLFPWSTRSKFKGNIEIFRNDKTASDTVEPICAAIYQAESILPWLYKFYLDNVGLGCCLYSNTEHDQRLDT